LHPNGIIQGEPERVVNFAFAKQQHSGIIPVRRSIAGRLLECGSIARCCGPDASKNAGRLMQYVLVAGQIDARDLKVRSRQFTPLYPDLSSVLSFCEGVALPGRSNP